MNKQLQIIGLAGTNGSGKDSAGQILAQYHNYLFISVTDLLRAELKARGLPITRENTRNLSAEWRRQQGLGVLINMAMASYQGVKDQYDGVVIASLRNPGEVDRVHALGGLVMWVDADSRIRYDRVQANAATRGRAGEDNKTYEQFQAEEAAEMNRSAGEDNATLNMSAVKQQSDVRLDNSKSDLTSLRANVEKTLGL
jgi:dephospho-CoA kinase